MPTCNRLTLAAAPSATFADTATRRITGIAVPAGATAEKGGRTWRFLDGSVKFADRVPLLAHHDTTRPAGRLTSHEWGADGLRVEFHVSRTSLGDELLQLAHDGVLGLSLGVDVPEGGARMVGEELHVSDALASEVSLTPIPAFAGSVIESVALSATTPEGTAMPDCNDKPGAVPAVTVNLDASALGAAIGAAMKPPATVDNGPTPVPVPTTTTTVREEAPYRFDGTRGKHGFIADCVDAQSGSGEAANRLNTFLRETFVTQSNVTPLNPVQQRPDLYQAPLRYNRPLAGLITTGTIASNVPFVLPKFSSAGNLVNPHVEGVEPTLGAFTATSQTITPGALSGKVEITREVWDARGNPAVDQLVWAEMQAAAAEAAERRIAALLDGLTLTPITVDGGSSTVNDMVQELIDLQYARGGNRYTSFAVHQVLYRSLAGERDGDGRPMLPMVGATNADGTASAGWGSLQIGNTTATPAWALGSHSYLMVPSSVFQWLSPPQKLTFDVQVKSVFIGLFQYSAEAVIRDTDVKRVDIS